MLATVYSVNGPMQLILNRIVQSTLARRQVTVLLTRVEILLACSSIWQIFSLFNVRCEISVVGLSICKHFLEVGLKFLLPYSSRSLLLLLHKNISSLRVVIWPLLISIDLLSLMRGLTPSIDLLEMLAFNALHSLLIMLKFLHPLNSNWITQGFCFELVCRYSIPIIYIHFMV